MTNSPSFLKNKEKKIKYVKNVKFKFKVKIFHNK